jgi:hypothetical protein
MPLHATTVRFPDDVWDVLEAEARRQRVSAAQLVRDATLMRLAGLVEARTGDNQTLERLTETRDARSEPPPGIRDRRRVAALRATGLLDSPPEARFDRIVRLAASVLGAPTALVSLVDEHRQFFKSCVGLAEPWLSSRTTPLSHSFCQYAVSAREPLVVGDANRHPLLSGNPAIHDLGIVAYLGVPLVTTDGAALGTLCVIDSRPRVWTSDQVDLAREFATLAVREIEHAN